MTLINSLIRSELKLDSVLNEEILLRFEISKDFIRPDLTDGSSYTGGPSLGVLVLFYSSYSAGTGTMASRRVFTTQLIYTKTPSVMQEWVDGTSSECQRDLTRTQTERMWSLVYSVGENILEPAEELELFDILFNKPIPEAVQLQLELT